MVQVVEKGQISIIIVKVDVVAFFNRYARSQIYFFFLLVPMYTKGWSWESFCLCTHGRHAHILWLFHIVCCVLIFTWPSYWDYIV